MTPPILHILKTKQKYVYASIKTLFDIVSRIYLTKILSSPYLRNCNAMGGGGVLNHFQILSQLINYSISKSKI